MTVSLPPNSIYLENLSFGCNEQDIYRKLVSFGPIKRIKIFYQNYQDTKYSIGYAFVQFSNNKGKKKCLENGKFIEIKKNIIRIYDHKPQTKFSTCLFVFYSDKDTTREKLNSFFMRYQLIETTIRSNPTLNHLGFAIIQFQSRDIFGYILQKTLNSPYQLILPSNELIELWPTKVSDSNKQIIFNPNIINDYDNFIDFEIVHDSTSYRVNSYLACVYSTRINQLFLSNSILDRVETRIKVNGNFSIIEDFLLGKEVKITKNDSQFIFLVSADLGIESLLHETYGFVYSSMNPEIAMFIYRQLDQIELSIENSPHIRYMAENITKMRLYNDFKTAKTELISSVLYYLNDHIRNINITQEEAESLSDWLIGFINQNKSDRSKLLQFIIVSSIPKVKTISIVNNPTFNINLIRRPLLKFLLKNKSLSEKDNGLLSNSEDSENSEDDTEDLVNNYRLVRCQDDKSESAADENMSSGVFKWLNNRYKENLHDIGIVSVTSNTSLHKIIEYNDNDNYWSSTDMHGSWITIDFKEFEVIPSSYTLKTANSMNCSRDNDEPPSLIEWKLEGSKDGSAWTVLDERRNTNSNYNSCLYRIDQKQRCRFVRLSQIGKNAAGNFSMCIQNIEFFGELPRQRKTIDYKPGSELEGIFSYMSSELGGNPALLNKIELTSSCDPKYLIDDSWNGTWKSPDEKRSWVKIDLIYAKVDLFSYALKSHGGPGYLRSWMVEVSDDDKKWYCVDEKRFVNDYNSPYQWIKWTCMKPFSNSIRYIKFTMTNLSEERKNIFWLSGIELFGDLIIPK